MSGPKESVHKSDHEEDVLKTQIHRLRSLTDEQPPDLVREWGWWMLTHKLNPERYRLAAEAIVSCGLKPDSRFYQRAQEWLRDHPDPRLVATALFEASKSNKSRELVWNEYFGKVLTCAVPADGLGIWVRIMGGERPQWNEIVAPLSGPKSIHHMPSEPWAFQACRAVFEPILPENLPHLVQSIMNVEEWRSNEELKKAILLTLAHSYEEVSQVVLANLDVFWPTLENFLNEDRNIISQIGPEQIRVDRLFQLAAQAVSLLSTEQLLGLINAEKPYGLDRTKLALAPHILPLIPPSKTMSRFFRLYGKLWWQSGQHERNLVPALTVDPDELFDLLSNEQVAQIVTESDVDSHYHTNQLYRMIERLARKPKLFRRTLGPFFTAPTKNIAFALYYCEKQKGQKTFRRDMEVFLKKTIPTLVESMVADKDKLEHYEKLICDYVAPLGFPLAPLFKDKLVDLFIKLDAVPDEPIRACRLDPRSFGHFHYGWSEEAIARRKDLLDRHIGLAESDLGLLRFLFRWNNSVNTDQIPELNAEKTIARAVAERPNFLSTVVVYAFQPDSYSEEALEILNRNPCWTERLIHEEREKVRRAIMHRFTVYAPLRAQYTVIDQFMVNADWIDAFFEEADLHWKPKTMAKWVAWLRSLPCEEGAAPLERRLTSWLLDQLKTNDTSSFGLERWLTIAAFFKDKPAVRKAAARFLEHRHRDIQTLAVQVVWKEYPKVDIPDLTDPNDD